MPISSVEVANPFLQCHSHTFGTFSGEYVDVEPVAVSVVASQIVPLPAVSVQDGCTKPLDDVETRALGDTIECSCGCIGNVARACYRMSFCSDVVCSGLTSSLAVPGKARAVATVTHCSNHGVRDGHVGVLGDSSLIQSIGSVEWGRCESYDGRIEPWLFQWSHSSCAHVTVESRLWDDSMQSIFGNGYFCSVAVAWCVIRVLSFTACIECIVSYNEFSFKGIYFGGGARRAVVRFCCGKKDILKMMRFN